MVNPEMLNERGRFVKKGTKPLDLVFFVLYPVVAIGGLVLMGFDARYGWFRTSGRGGRAYVS